jgi:hypothetical protein
MSPMMPKLSICTPVLCATCVLSYVSAQSQLVVPAAHTTTDGAAQVRIAGAGSELRQQTLIGAQHLLSMVGSSIEAIELRRTAVNETFMGGVTNLTITLSTTTTNPIDCSSTFAANVGAFPDTVFSGVVTIPTSPAVQGNSVPWSSDNTIKINLTTTYTYLGGTLCVDITGTPVVGQEPGWWMTDAAAEHIGGTVTDLGDGCGNFGGTSSTWGTMDSQSLMAGGYAHMHAYGTPYGLAIAAIGPKTPAIPLTNLGFSPPGNCALRIFPIDMLIPAIFVPSTNPAVANWGGRADFDLKIPNLPGAHGLTLTTQWFDWNQQATSNAIEWVVSTTQPTLDMAFLEAHPSSATGQVAVDFAPVLRFLHQ